ncbi:hypothetical protein [Herbaspirillum huttiense]|uniref:hypothetical protein n=1 Tax=Herbaspirillum huttiense TaxID=863372 RepID=UPI0031E268FA
MSDHADNADHKIYQAIEVGLAAARRAPVLQPDCRCHFCEEKVMAGQVFCDIDCRDDYQRHQMLNNRTGRAWQHSKSGV